MATAAAMGEHCSSCGPVADGVKRGRLREAVFSLTHTASSSQIQIWEEMFNQLFLQIRASVNSEMGKWFLGSWEKR